VVVGIFPSLHCTDCVGVSQNQTGRVVPVLIEMVGEFKPQTAMSGPSSQPAALCGSTMFGLSAN
jgi:hypothetical protein